MLKGKKMLLTFVASAALVGGVFAISQSKVDAKSYSKAVTKIAGNGNYAIYHNVSKKGPSGAFSNTKYFKHGQIQSKKYVSTKKGNFWYIIVDGRNVGWVSQNFFARNQISVAQDVSLVHNSNYSFPTRDAINYATDGQGTAINPDKVNVSHSSVSSSRAGTTKVDYSYGRAKASVNVTVRSDTNEGITSAGASVKSGPKAVHTWNGGSKGSSRNWNQAHGYRSETSSNSYSGNGMTLRTRLFQPRFVSLGYGQAADAMGQVGVIPEGITVNDGIFTASMYTSSSDSRGHLVSYNLNAIKNKYAAQNLTTMGWSTFRSYANNIKVSPYIKLGHGQSLGSSSSYIYVLANNNKTANSTASEEIMQVRKSDMKINKIWTVKTWNGSSAYPRYFHNATFVGDNTMYALFHNGGRHQYEYWKLTRNGDTWTPEEIGATQSNFVTGSPVQGFAYDSNHNQFYIGFNDYIFCVAANGTYKGGHHFNTRREIEGLSVSGSTLYTELAQRAELMTTSTK